MTLPTFLVAGAQKCGTSSLAGLLRRHPQIFMAQPKELHYFDHKIGRGLDWYAEQFTPGPDQVQVGEATPVYLYDPVLRKRIMETLPDASIIVILREPVRRAYSQYWHSSRLGYEKAPTFEEALDLEAVRAKSDLRSDRIRHAYVDRGRFIDQLLDLESGFGRDQLHVLLLEDLIEDRVTTLARAFDFLKISTEPAAKIKQQWKAKYTLPPINPETRVRLLDEFRPYNERLAAWLGRDLSAWDTA